MPARDKILVHLIAEALEKSPALGANQLYEKVSLLYVEKKGPTKRSRRPTKRSRRPTKRSRRGWRRHFFKYLGLMIKDGLVINLGNGARGKRAKLYLTEIGKMQYYQNKLDLPSLSDETQISNMKDRIPQALYAIILYFNQGVWYTVHTEGALEYILREFGLSMSSLIIRSDKSIVRSDSEDIMQVIYQSPKEDAIVFKDVFLRSNTHERGTTQYRCFLRGVTCEAILEDMDLRVFRYLGFTSEDIRSAIESLCSNNVLKPTGSLGPAINNEVIYKIDKSIFDIMTAMDLFHNNALFSRVESIMTEIWSNFRPPTDDEKQWLYFVYGNEDADQIINNAHESRKKITNGESMRLYIKKIRNDKVKLIEVNKKIVEINNETTRIVDLMKWAQESYKTTIYRHKTLLKNIYEVVYPDFFSEMYLKTF